MSYAAGTSDKGYATYKKAQVVGSKLYQDFMRINGRFIRASVVLKWCGKDGLAQAVEAKITDRNFQLALLRAIDENQFEGDDSEILTQTQNVANATVVGYTFGYQAGLSLRGDKIRNEICDAAPEMANQILK
jgi:hypothetical protein